MKLCVDCKHYGGVKASNGTYICNEPRNSYPSVVDGFEVKVSCDLQRLFEVPQRCGPEGKWWEPKSPLSLGAERPRGP